MILPRRNSKQRRPSPPARVPAAPPTSAARRVRRGLTLTELLVTIGLMVFLASIALFGMWEAQEVAREGRARSQVERINALLQERWDDYSSRAVPLRVTPARILIVDTTATASVNRASFEKVRVNGLRELGRFEMPDRQTDVATGPAFLTPPAAVTLPAEPSLLFAYRRILGATTPVPPGRPDWSSSYQGAECLYAILATMTKGDQNGLDFFKPSEVGDKDNDQRPEIWDPWGNPIEFIRWAPGLDSPLHKVKEVQTIQLIGRPVRGEFRLYLNAATNRSSPIQFNATAAQVQSAIESMASNNNTPLDLDDPNDPPVVGPSGGPWTVRFAQYRSDVTPPQMALPPLMAVSDDPSDTSDFTLDNNMVADSPTDDPNLASVRVTTDFTDPFDPNEAWEGGPPLHFLVVSAGRDQQYGIFGLIDPENVGLVGATGTPPTVNYSQYDLDGGAPAPLVNPDPPANPYRKVVDPMTGDTAGRFLGEPFDYDGNGVVTPADRGPSTDNLTNHLTDAG